MCLLSILKKNVIYQHGYDTYEAIIAYLIFFQHSMPELKHGYQKLEAWKQEVKAFQRHLIPGLGHNITESPSPGNQHPMWGQGYLPEDSQQFLRLRRGHGTDLPTAEQGWEWRSWRGQQSWEETQEQVPVLGHTGLARAGTSHPAPSHPVPGTSADLAKRKHKGRGERGIPGNAITTAEDLSLLWELESQGLAHACSFLFSEATENIWDAPAPAGQWPSRMQAALCQSWEQNGLLGLCTDSLAELRLVRSR